MQVLSTGTLAGIGSFQCENCGYALSLEAADALPTCPACEGESFKRSSLFATQILSEEHHEEISVAADWVDEARSAITEPGDYLAFDDEDGDIKVVALQQEWTRLGRSLAADIRFDDPSVSRRHALIVRQPDGVRVLDDRSLNGVFVNGERLEWSKLCDGDEITVGRHVLRFIAVETTAAARSASAASAA